MTTTTATFRSVFDPIGAAPTKKPLSRPEALELLRREYGRVATDEELAAVIEEGVRLGRVAADG